MIKIAQNLKPGHAELLVKILRNKFPSRGTTTKGIKVKINNQYCISSKGYIESDIPISFLRKITPFLQGAIDALDSCEKK